MKIIVTIISSNFNYKSAVISFFYKSQPVSKCVWPGNKKYFIFVYSESRSSSKICRIQYTLIKKFSYMFFLFRFPEYSDMNIRNYNTKTHSTHSLTYLLTLTLTYRAIKPRMFYLTGSDKKICDIALTLLLMVVWLFLDFKPSYVPYMKKKDRAV